MTSCTTKRCFGGNSLDPFGFPQEIRTQFFHQRASQRCRKNTIKGLHDTNWIWHTNTGEIATIVEAYYKELFTALTDLNMEGVLASMDSVDTEEMARNLTLSYTEEEVRVALF